MMTAPTTRYCTTAMLKICAKSVAPPKCSTRSSSNSSRRCRRTCHHGLAGSALQSTTSPLRRARSTEVRSCKRHSWATQWAARRATRGAAASSRRTVAQATPPSSTIRRGTALSSSMIRSNRGAPSSTTITASNPLKTPIRIAYMVVILVQLSNSASILATSLLTTTKSIYLRAAIEFNSGPSRNCSRGR